MPMIYPQKECLEVSQQETHLEMHICACDLLIVVALVVYAPRHDTCAFPRPTTHIN